MNGFKYQAGIVGRGLTARRRVAYGARALVQAPILVIERKAVLGKARTERPLAVRFMNDLSNATLGRGLDIGNRVIAVLRRRATKQFDREMSTHESTKLTTSDISRLVAQIRSTGFAKLPEFVAPDVARRLCSQVEALDGHEDLGAVFDSMTDWMDRGSMPRFVLSEAGLASLKDLQGIDMRPLAMIAREVLGAAPQLLGPRSWITRPLPNITDNQKEDSAMAFHCDSDFFGFLKVFLLLTEVRPENGPFTFVSGSHRGKRHVQGRVEDSMLDFASEELCFGTGKPGDVVLAMTCGWHKATPPVAGHRTMAQWLFTNGLFGSVS